MFSLEKFYLILYANLLKPASMGDTYFYPFGSIDVSNMTTAVTPKTQICANKITPAQPFSQALNNVVERSLMSTMQRPVLQQTAHISLSAQEFSIFEIENPVNAARADVEANATGMFGIFSEMFAAYYGGWIHTLIIRGNASNITAYLLNDVQNNNEAIVPEAVTSLPIPSSITELRDTRFGWTMTERPDPTVSTRPTTTLFLPGKLTVHNTARSLYRCFSSRLEGFPSTDNTVSALVLWREDAGDAEQVSIDDYISAAPRARFALFTGMPPFYVSYLTDVTKAAINYADYHFLTPA